MKEAGKNILSWGGNLLAVIASAVQENEIVQWILFALGIVGSILSIALSLMRIYSKWKEISKDGTITDEEMKEFADTIAKEKDNIENSLPKKDNEEKEEK